MYSNFESFFLIEPDRHTVQFHIARELSRMYKCSQSEVSKPTAVIGDLFEYVILYKIYTFYSGN